MSATHPDEATLLRSVMGDLPAPRSARLVKHLASCAACRIEHERTLRLHGRLAGVAGSLAFPVGDPFERRPAPVDATPTTGAAVRWMEDALSSLEKGKQVLRTAIDSDASNAGTEIDLDDAPTRLAAAHLLEDAITGDPSENLVNFAAAIEGREADRAGEAEAVLPLSQLRALAHLVVGNWKLFSGRWREAGSDLGAAWAALAEFDAPEHLVAWVEVGESLRRSYARRPLAGRLLAERALGTFEAYGLGRGLLRARHARSVALYTSGKFREAHRAFRVVLDSKDATTLDRARAVSGAAFCLAAQERFPEAAKEYSRVRRRLHGAGAQVEQYLLLGEMKAALGTTGRWRGPADRVVAFVLPEQGGAFYARSQAINIVQIGIADGAAKIRLHLDRIAVSSAGRYALVGAVQLAMTKISSAPVASQELACALRLAGTRLAPEWVRPGECISIASVVGEAALLESCSLSFMGRLEEAALKARDARTVFDSDGVDPFRLAVADYFEGSACVFLRDVSRAERLLRESAVEFARFGQEQWYGRCEAIMATLLMQEAQPVASVAMFDKALSHLDVDRDAVAYGNVLGNRPQALLLAGQVGAASAAYARALKYARSLGLTITIFTVRYCLAVIELRKGRVERARCAFDKIAAEAELKGLPQRVFTAKLRSAECLGRLGRSVEMLAEIRSLRATFDSFAVDFEPGIRELFALADESVVSIEMVAHVADYCEARNRCVSLKYAPFRLLKGGP